MAFRIFVHTTGNGDRKELAMYFFKTHLAALIIMTDSICFIFHFCLQLSWITLKTGVKGKHPLLWQSVWAHSGKKVSDTSECGCQECLAGSWEPEAPVERLLWGAGISQSATRCGKSYPGSKWDQAGFAAPQKLTELTHKWQHTTPPARAKWAELLRSLLLISILFLWYSVISISSSFEVGLGFFFPYLKMTIILLCILGRPDPSECKTLLVIFEKLAMGEKAKPRSCGQHWIPSQASVPQADKSSHFQSAGSLFWERLLLQYYKIGTHKSK